MPSGFDFLFRTRPRALWQQTPPEPVLILQRSPLRQFSRARLIDEYDVTIPFAWRHRSTVVTSKCWDRKDRPWRQWRNELSIIVFSGIVCSGHKMACKKYDDTFVTMNNDFFVTGYVICQWKALANHLTRDQKSLLTVTHALFYIFRPFLSGHETPKE